MLPFYGSKIIISLAFFIPLTYCGSFSQSSSLANWLNRDTEQLLRQIKLRFRYILAMSVAISKKVMADETLYLSAYHEMVLDTESNYFDRDRIYGGFGYRFNARQTRNQLNFFVYFNY